jgi:anti-anti-sigma regulatory factor
MQVIETDGVRVVSLPPVLDMVAAAELKVALESAMDEGGVRIEAADVQRVSTPALQVLAAAARSYAQRGLPFAFGGCARPLSEGAVLLGIADVLGIDGDLNG